MKSQSFFDKGNLYLAYQIARCQMLSQDRNVILGNLWHVLHPLLISFVLLTVFSSRFNVKIQHYGFYILLGMVHFNFFSGMTSKASKILLKNRSLLLSHTIPKSILIIAAGFTRINNLFDRNCRRAYDYDAQRNFD